MDEDMPNDSGINSGSDFHSSSPGSDNSQDYNPVYSAPNMAPHAPYYSTPVTSQCGRQSNFSMYHMGFNPLTPPSIEPLVSPKPPKLEAQADECNTTLTPHASPTPQEPKTPSSTDSDKRRDDHDNPLRQLQMTFEKNGLLPSALSPKTNSEHSGDDDIKESWDENEEGVRTPAVNSHGKVKTFKCKQCDFVAITKMDFWEHSKAHIKTDKILTCPKCPFVTEYKHHLEYHLRNHFGSKPFKCDKCNYSCVNKSMLNSHMKSHSNVYQYRCQDCSYATKYCHSLKLHLRKYRHQPAMVLNPDGTPNPLPIIDVYGTRRGPKQKGNNLKGDQTPIDPEHATSFIPTSQAQPLPQLANNPFATIMNFASQGQLSNLPFPYPFFPGALSNQLLLAQQLASHNASAYEDRCSEKSTSPPPSVFMSENNEETFSQQETTGALDLSKPEAPTKHRRKGKAFKLERPQLQMQSDGEEEPKDPDVPTPIKALTTPLLPAVIKAEPSPLPPTIPSAADCTCKFCGIAFGDVVLYTMHMGYHGYKDPFTCNMCGEQCNDKVAFFLHIARNPHT